MVMITRIEKRTVESCYQQIGNKTETTQRQKPTGDKAVAKLFMNLLAEFDKPEKICPQGSGNTLCFCFVEQLTQGCIGTVKKSLDRSGVHMVDKLSNGRLPHLTSGKLNTLSSLV